MLCFLFRLSYFMDLESLTGQFNAREEALLTGFILVVSVLQFKLVSTSVMKTVRLAREELHKDPS